MDLHLQRFLSYPCSVGHPEPTFDAEAVSRAAGHSTPADSCAATAATDRDCSAAADPDSDAFDPVRPGCADWAVC